MELNPDLLLASFQVQTNWQVITDTVSFGKSSCFHHRYASVFVLAPLPLRKDGARASDADKVGLLDEWLARDYSALGYTVVRVPVLAPEARLAFVLGRLSRQGLVWQLGGGGRPEVASLALWFVLLTRLGMLVLGAACLA
jgi:hypothetical protein